MRWIWKALLLIVALPTLACARDRVLVVAHDAPAARVEQSSAAVATSDALEVHYLGNEGFLVESGGRRVLIDALFGEGISGYDAVPVQLRASLERGTGTWGGVEIALASHFHRDHFDPDAVARFLDANPLAIFISTPQAAESFAESNPDRPELIERFRAVLPEPGTVESLDVAGVRIDVLNLHHGAGNPPTQNLGVIVSLGRQRFLHLGDTEAKMVDFEPYLEILVGTDVALLPFWFLSSEWRADMVHGFLRPQRIAVAHMPTRDAPAGYFARWKSYDELRALIESRFPDAWFATHQGEVMP